MSARIWKWRRSKRYDVAPPLPPPTIDSLMETWNSIQAASEQPLLRYMSTAEYAVECVCLFLRWGMDEHAAFGDDVVWVTPPGRQLRP